jgi:hypothetical protein
VERQPQRNESAPEPVLRPLLEVDLSSGDGLPFNLVSMAMNQLEGEQLAKFNMTIWLATQQGSGATYNDVLRVVDSYVDLVDTSDTFTTYGPPGKILTAIERLNTAIGELPVVSNIKGLYPNGQDLSAAAYYRRLWYEIGRTEQIAEQSELDKREALEQYKKAMMRCAAELKRYGV